MKKTAFYFASMAVLAIGCQAEMEPDNPLGGEVSEVTFTAVTESSADVKTSLNQSAVNDKIYNIHWSAGDKVLVSDDINSAEYTASPSEETPTYAGLYTTATTTPADDAEKYYAVFPSLEGVAAGPEGYTVVVPAEQTWVQGEFDMPMVGLGDAEHHIAFMNAASILKITPNNLCDSYDGVRVAKIEVSASSGNIAGTMSVTYDGSADPEVSEVTGGSNTITLDCGEDGAPFSETFYIALVPGSYETLTITITSNGGGSQTFTLNTPEGKAYERSEYASVGVKISNLAIYETANCYLIKKAGTYKFPVNVRGNGKAEILKRESSNSATYVTYNYSPVSIDPSSISSTSTTVISQQDKTVSEHDSALTVTDVQLRDGYIHFTVPEGFTPGNIRVGIHGEDAGKYIWSWHIWVNGQVEDVDMDKMHNNLDYGTKILNMNLGSLQTKENLAGYAGVNSGLYYQWGRKDPFPPMNGSDVTMPEGYTVDAHCNGATATHHRSKVENAINYPADFYSGNQVGSQIRTWCDESLYHHWAAAPTNGNSAAMATYYYEKSMFDPCPPGYRILDPFTVKTIAYTGNTKTYHMTNYDELGYMQTQRGDKPVFPYDGCRTPGATDAYDTAGNLADAGTAPYYWVASTWNKDNQNACILRITGVTITNTVDDVTETVTHQYANIQKYVKSYAASIRPMRDSK